MLKMPRGIEASSACREAARHVRGMPHGNIDVIRNRGIRDRGIPEIYAPKPRGIPTRHSNTGQYLYPCNGGVYHKATIAMSLINKMKVWVFFCSFVLY